MTCILYSIFGDHVKEVGTKGEICFSTIFNLSLFREKVKISLFWKIPS